MIQRSVKIILLLVAIFGSSQTAFAQSLFQPNSARPDSSLVFEFQAYPTGIIPGVTFERFLSKNSAVNFRIGRQIIRHGDEGVHEDERGLGFGGSVGFRRYMARGISLGARVDLWRNSLDWADNIGQANEVRGQTDVTVLQPVVEVTWRRVIAGDWFVQPSGAVGAEINIVTDGEDTGEGFIALLALSIGKSF